jgi:hypothetical protein
MFGHGDYYHKINIEKSWLPYFQQRSLEFEILYGRDVKTAGHYHEIFNKTGELDVRSYTGPAGASEDDLISDELADAWIAVNPAIYVFLTDAKSKGDRILGYANAMPLKKEAFNRVLAGEIEDNEIKGEDIVPYNMAGPIRLYFMSIVIEPDARRIADGVYQRAFERLLYAVISQLVDFRRNYGVTVAEIAAVAWTPEGKVLCEWLGMELVGRDKKGRPIYLISIDERLSRRKDVFAGLHDLYRS